MAQPAETADSDDANANIRREPGLPDHEEIVREPPAPVQEFDFGEPDSSADDAATQRRMHRIARIASLDPDDGIQL